jgi:hypothetical protein
MGNVAFGQGTVTVVANYNGAVNPPTSSPTGTYTVQVGGGANQWQIVIDFVKPAVGGGWDALPGPPGPPFPVQPPAGGPMPLNVVANGQPIPWTWIANPIPLGVIGGWPANPGLVFVRAQLQSKNNVPGAKWRTISFDVKACP